ncbi:CDT1-like protein a, chloroplastic [Cajanus cajan]|uniref:CDT1-like protein a, chloroplastic n=1 Tax=Cajanus cajan TaxID=3821 RepID=UPI00098DA98C|nr:CDT1-like protein a, chloroplastic [Cajanus cajan]
MEHKSCEDSSKIASDFKCEKALQVVDESIACPTPQKNSEPLTIASREGQTEIPQKHWTLAELFSHMSCSLRLLRLRKKPPTFQNVSRQVEILSKRKISYVHLAQMKHILPDGICIDKILVHDKKTLCMVPDLNIILRYEVVEDHSGESADLALRRYFNSSLVNFLVLHPEVADIPEAQLPEPFNRKARGLSCEDSHVKDFSCQSLRVNSSTKLLSTSNQIEMSGNFEVYPLFRRRFSRKNIADQTERVEFSSTITSSSSHASDCLDNQESEKALQTERVEFSSTITSPSSHASDCLDNQESEKALQKGCAPLADDVASLNMETEHHKKLFSMSSQPSVVNTPVHTIGPHSVTCNNSETPKVKNMPRYDSFMTETPAQSAPARLLPISDVKPRNMSTQKSSSYHKPAKRVLDFTLMEGNDDLDISLDKLESSRLPHGFPESIRACSDDCNSSDSVPVLQEAHTQNQTGLDTQHKKHSQLLDLVKVIHSIFQSVNRIPITKEELMQKILTNSLDFVDIREVEERVESLEKLVPDWIRKKSLLIGDMYCINEDLELDSVESRISSKEIV